MVAEIDDMTHRPAVGPAATELPTEPLTGLTEAEVVQRRAAGLGNDIKQRTTRSYWQILGQNAFTSINTILYIIAAALLLMRLYGDALATGGLVLLNVIVGVFQEARAKRTLDRISLLARPTASVIRDGERRSVDPAELVVGDLIALGPGDQVVVDGKLVGTGAIEVDESLLTGESNPVPKYSGDPVYSGSFCLSGSGVYEAEQVGRESMAQQITAGARVFRQIRTPLQREVDLLLRAMLLLIIVIAGPTVIDLLVRALSILTSPISGSLAHQIDRAYQGYALEGTVRSAAVVVGLVPQGLSLMVTVTYALGAVRLAGRGALIQQANALESLSHVDVLCLDKTGTLTTNRIVSHAIRPIGITEPELAAILGDFAASVSSRNSTAEAIAAAFPGSARRLAEEIPFSSAWKWSAVVFPERADAGAYILGAPEVLRPALVPGSDLGDIGAAWVEQGLRVLLFARAPVNAPLRDAADRPRLPKDLEPIGLLCFSDELRPEARATLENFAAAGIQVKIISGDNPDTVAALARQVGLAGLTKPREEPVESGEPERVISGMALAEMDETEFAAAAKDGLIFGRITPQQKKDLVRSLGRQGNYVAMIGDGVNDVLALKAAKVGIAMQSGSQAARGVADLILLNDSFAVLPAAFREGQRIISGMSDIIRLFLVRSFYVMFLIIGADIAGAAFPVTPRHNALLATLTVGIPTFALAAWAKPTAAPRRFFRAIAPFVITAASSIGLIALIPYLYYLRVNGDLFLARSVMTTTAMFCAIILILFVQPPTRWWVAGDDLAGDWRPVGLAVVMLALFILALALPSLRQISELAVLSWIDLLVAVALAAIWTFTIRAAWRGRWLPRFLGLASGDVDTVINGA